MSDVTKTYSYDAYGTRIGMDRVQGTTSESFTYGYDVHGNVSLLLQGSTVRASYGYKPYGETDTNLTKGDINQQNPLNPYRYSGKRLDSGSGTLDMGARRFAPDVGRFLTPDVYQGAVSDLGLSLDPLTQNRYAFAGGNPISFIETDGHRFEDDGPNVSRKVSGREGRRLARAVEEATGADLGVSNRASGGEARAAIQHVAASPVGNMAAMSAMRHAVDAQIARRAYAAEHNPLSRSEALDIAGMFLDPIDAVRCGGDVVGGRGLTANCFGAIPIFGILRMARHVDTASGATRGATRVKTASRACTANSFTPRTRVLMANGSTKRIKNVEVGDWVWANDPVRGKAGPRRVTATIAGHGKKRLVEIGIDGRRVIATDGHPFWIDDQQRWVDAEDLDKENLLLGSDGRTVEVDGVVQTTQFAVVYNLAVEGIHTYHVVAGSAAVLVHNCNIGPKIAGQMDARGWTDDLVRDVRANPDFTRAVWDVHADAPATAYARGDNFYVVINDETGDVIQISNRLDPSWKPVWNDPKFAPR